MPKVSVLLPVYNAEKYIKDALHSVLNQTFQDFEILILNDGSTDQSIAKVKEVIQETGETRIKINDNPKNMGICHTLNRGIDLATGEYLARMDADDLCLPARFQKQVDFLDRNPRVDVLGTAFKTFGGLISRTIHHPEHDSEIKAAFFFDTALAHPTVMMRRTPILQNKLYYDPHYDKAEDYELWTRASFYLRFANLSEPLLHYRNHAQQTSTSLRTTQFSRVGLARKVFLEKLGISLTDEQFKTHGLVSNFSTSHLNSSNINTVVEWMNTITSQLRIKHADLVQAFTNEAKRKLTAGYYMHFFSFKMKRALIQNQLLAPELITWKERIYFLLKAKFGVLKRILQKLGL